MKRFPFSKRAIEALPAHSMDSPSREAEYTDMECIGLHLRVGKSGRKFFQHRYRHLGRKKCVTLGEFPHVTVQEARQKVSEHKALLAREVDPANERTQQRNDLTFAEFAKTFYVPHATMHKKTWQEDVYKIDRWINPALGKLRLSAITSRDISSFQAKVREKNSATTANHYLILVRRMLNLAVKWGLLEKNPASGVDKFKEPPHRERYLTKDELPRFLRSLDLQDDRLCVAAIKLLLFTGCRKGEILGLRWEDVQEGRLYLPMTKNGKARTVILNAKAREVIAGLRERKEVVPLTRDSAYLFPSRDGSRKKHIVDLRVPFEKVCEAADIQNLRIHDLRHSFATIAVMSGASLYEIKELLGHSDVSMTQRYAHMLDDNLQRATDNVSSAIDEASVGVDTIV